MKSTPQSYPRKKTNTEYTDQICEIFIEFSGEVVKLYNDRHGNSLEALRSIVLEQNQKWNALSRIFEKHNGVSPLKEDGFKNYWTNKFPELI